MNQKQFNFYLDKKVIVWVREIHSIEAENYEVAKNKMIGSFQENLCAETFVQQDFLYKNSEDFVDPENNNGEATIELCSEIENNPIASNNITSYTKLNIMTKDQLENLLNEACELLIIFEEGNIANEEDKNRISAIFNEIKYSDEIDSEMNLDNEIKLSISADDEAQDWEVFGDNKI